MEKNTIYSNNIDCNLYKWNLDKNGFPLFTEKNLKFTVALVENDSKYRISFDATHPKSSAYLLSQGFPTEETIRDVVKLLDKENATHLSVSGVKTGKTNNQGIEIFVVFQFRCKIIEYCFIPYRLPSSPQPLSVCFYE